MSAKSAIEWTDATWNPVTGCTKVSPGCDHCYAETVAHRFAGTPAYPKGFEPTLRPDRLTQPLRWRRPRRIFVNSMSDLFHDAFPGRYIAAVFAVMAATPRHTYQVLTKRHARMRSLLASPEFIAAVTSARQALALNARPGETLPEWEPTWPLPNVWMGVSVENQQWADIRVPALLQTPAAVRFLSCEPLLGPVRLSPDWLVPPAMICGPGPYSTQGTAALADHLRAQDTSALADVLRAAVRRFASEMAAPAPAFVDWVIVGGESGWGARPMHPEWARSLRDQCRAAGVPFHFKQWGEWAPSLGRSQRQVLMWPDGAHRPDTGPPYLPAGWTQLEHVGKKAAGRELDGRTWDEYPTNREAV